MAMDLLFIVVILVSRAHQVNSYAEVSGVAVSFTTCSNWTKPGTVQLSCDSTELIRTRQVLYGKRLNANANDGPFCSYPYSGQSDCFDEYATTESYVFSQCNLKSQCSVQADFHPMQPCLDKGFNGMRYVQVYYDCLKKTLSNGQPLIMTYSNRILPLLLGEWGAIPVLHLLSGGYPVSQATNTSICNVIMLNSFRCRVTVMDLHTAIPAIGGCSFVLTISNGAQTFTYCSSAYFVFNSSLHIVDLSQPVVGSNWTVQVAFTKNPAAQNMGKFWVAFEALTQNSSIGAGIVSMNCNSSLPTLTVPISTISTPVSTTTPPMSTTTTSTSSATTTTTASTTTPLSSSMTPISSTITPVPISSAIAQITPMSTTTTQAVTVISNSSTTTAKYTSTTSQQPLASLDKEQQLHLAPIIGGVVAGGFLILLLVILAIVVLCRRHYLLYRPNKKMEVIEAWSSIHSNGSSAALDPVKPRADPSLRNIPTYLYNSEEYVTDIPVTFGLPRSPQNGHINHAFDTKDDAYFNGNLGSLSPNKKSRSVEVLNGNGSMNGRHSPLYAQSKKKRQVKDRYADEDIYTYSTTFDRL